MGIRFRTITSMYIESIWVFIFILCVKKQDRNRYLNFNHCDINSYFSGISKSLQWRHNGCDGVSYHQPHDCLLNCLFRRRSKKTPKSRATGLCEGNSPGTDKFPAQRASNAEDVSIWLCHHVITSHCFMEMYLLIQALILCEASLYS